MYIYCVVFEKSVLHLVFIYVFMLWRTFIISKVGVVLGSGSVFLAFLVSYIQKGLRLDGNIRLFLDAERIKSLISFFVFFCDIIFLNHWNFHLDCSGLI